MLRISKQDFLELGKKSRGQAILRVAAEASFVDKQKQQIDLVARRDRDQPAEVAELELFHHRLIEHAAEDAPQPGHARLAGKGVVGVDEHHLAAELFQRFAELLCERVGPRDHHAQVVRRAKLQPL